MARPIVAQRAARAPKDSVWGVGCYADNIRRKQTPRKMAKQDTKIHASYNMSAQRAESTRGDS